MALKGPGVFELLFCCAAFIKKYHINHWFHTMSPLVVRQSLVLAGHWLRSKVMKGNLTAHAKCNFLKMFGINKHISSIKLSME